LKMNDWLAKAKRGIALISAAGFALALLAEVAIAYPQYSQKTGKACSYCHTNPKGGKELTAAGKYYSKNKTLKGYTPSGAKGKQTATAGKKTTTKKTTTATAGKPTKKTTKPGMTSKKTTTTGKKPTPAPKTGGKGRGGQLPPTN
jgi:hypothetical protein